VTDLGQLRDDGDRRSVRFERRYDAAPEAVWAAVTEPEQMRGWLAEVVEFDHTAGGTIHLRFGDGPDEVAYGAVLAFEPPSVLEYEWHWPGEDHSVVRFELLRDGEGTLLLLEHRGLPPAAAIGYGAGWHAHLDCLEAVVRGRAAPDWDARFSELLPSYR